MSLCKESTHIHRHKYVCTHKHMHTHDKHAKPDKHMYDCIRTHVSLLTLTSFTPVTNLLHLSTALEVLTNSVPLVTFPGGGLFFWWQAGVNEGKHNYQKKNVCAWYAMSAFTNHTLCCLHLRWQAMCELHLWMMHEPHMYDTNSGYK